MDIQLVQKPLHLDLYGFSAKAVDQKYGEAGFMAMSKMWQVVKSRGLKNRGINVWVYDANEQVFAGVELEEAPDVSAGLERREIRLVKYAYYKHIGPYSKLKEVYQGMRDELLTRGVTAGLPSLEIYGHMDPDESKLETEVLIVII